MPEPAPDTVQTPRIVRKQRRISWIWLVPIVAALAGATLIVRTWMETGPRITITFNTAAGLEVGKTQVRYKDVTVGTVSGIRLSDDWRQVVVTADISSDAAGLAAEGTRFWVVRPRLALSGVSGLGTLLSGVYIEVDTPRHESAAAIVAKREFTGLEEPPEIIHDRPGRNFVLKAGDIGSLEIGSPVYFRRLAVGRVVDYELDDTGTSVEVDIFVDAPHDRYVTSASRFWNASGFDVNVSTDGLQLRTESLVSVLLGGIAFDSPVPGATPADPGSEFDLYATTHAAHTPPDGEPWPIRMRFDQSVRGLAVGALVDFKGVKLGNVTRISLEFDPEQKAFFTLVDADLFPKRLGPVYEQMQRLPALANQPDGMAAFMLGMVERGLRAQLRTANLLTGQLFIILDVFPEAEKVTPALNTPTMVPTIKGEFDQIQQQVLSIVGKLEKLPLEQIAEELRATLANSARVMARLDTQIAPEARALLRQARQAMQDAGNLLAADAALPVNAERTLQEVARAARSLRQFSDYLQANPDVLLRGRGPDLQLGSSGGRP